MNHTRGSVLLAVIAHAAFNGSMTLLPIMLGVDKQLGLIPLLLMLAAGLWAFAIVLIAVFGAKRLSQRADFTFEEVLSAYENERSSTAEYAKSAEIL